MKADRTNLGVEAPRREAAGGSVSAQARPVVSTAGELFVLSAPSGTGKTTLVHRLTRGEVGSRLSLYFAISHTTRTPRRTEVDGADYFFVDSDRFRSMIDRNEFLEWAEVHENFYGTSLAEVAPRLERGRDVLLDIDVQGAAAISERWAGPDRPVDTAVHRIFIVPPSYSALEQRIRSRGLNDESEIARRLTNSYGEIERALDYDYVIVNDDAAVASQALAAVILDKRYRRARMAAELNAVLADFTRICDRAQGRLREPGSS